MIQLQQVSKRYAGGQDALRDVTLHIEAGEKTSEVRHRTRNQNLLVGSADDMNILTGLGSELDRPAGFGGWVDRHRRSQIPHKVLALLESQARTISEFEEGSGVDPRHP